MTFALNRLLFWAILIVSPFVFLTNPFHGVPGTDSSIFIYVARGLQHGIMPYRDVFDQKGFLIYLIDYVGVLIGGVCGLWLLDGICLLIGIFIMWKILQCCIGCIPQGHEHESKIRCSALGLILLFYHVVACGGNMPEMWIVVFAGMAWMLVVQSIVLSRVTVGALLGMGICLALIGLLKFNMLAVAVPVGIVALTDGGRIGVKFKERVRNLFAVLVGLAVVFVPVVIWFFVNDALDDFFEVYVIYNAKYASILREMRSGNIFDYTGRAFWPVVFVVVVNIYMINVFHRKKERREIDARPIWISWLNLLFLVISFGLILFSGASHRYYGPILPACIILIWFILNRFKLKPPVTAGILIFCLLAVSGLAFMRNSGDTKSQYIHLRDIGEKIGLIGSNSVLVLGCDCHAYWVLDAWCPTRFPFQGTIGYCSQRYKQQIIDDIRSCKAEWIVEPKGVLDIEGALGVSWAKEALFSQYSLIVCNDNYGIWRRNESKVNE